MSNNTDTKLDISGNATVIKLVTTPFLNIRCIVCGTAFERPRVGKLYCSTRCKQFRYNHKDQIEQVKNRSLDGINSRPLRFNLDEFLNYDKIRKGLIRLKQLSRKRSEWEGLDAEIRYRQSQLLSISDHSWDRHYSERITEDEEGELYDLETNLDEDYLSLDLKDLSLEQWSFLRSIHCNLHEGAFFQLVSSISKQFIAQLSLRENGNSSNDFVIIQNKFINHCNLIATGIIVFNKSDKDGDS